MPFKGGNSSRSFDEWESSMGEGDMSLRGWHEHFKTILKKDFKPHAPATTTILTFMPVFY